MYKALHRAFVGGVHPLVPTPGDDATYRHCPMTHQRRQPRQRGAFHLEVGDAPPSVFERLDFPIQFRVRQREAQLAPLWAVEAVRRDGHAAKDVISAYLLDK